MATQVPPKKNTAFVTYVGLVSQANALVFQPNPTLAAGDVKVSIDGAALANITTLPDVDPDNSKLVKVSLSTDEMNGDNIQVIFSDAAGNEWCDLIINIQTVAHQIDELALATAFTSALADSVAADGSRPSVNQALLMLTRMLMERSVSGTTVTVKKEDGTTASMTFTINDSVQPTSITRAS